MENKLSLVRASRHVGGGLPRVHASSWLCIPGSPRKALCWRLFKEVAVLWSSRATTASPSAQPLIFFQSPHHIQCYMLQRKSWDIKFFPYQGGSIRLVWKRSSILYARIIRIPDIYVAIRFT